MYTDATFLNAEQIGGLRTNELNVNFGAIPAMQRSTNTWLSKDYRNSGLAMWLAENDNQTFEVPNIVDEQITISTQESFDIPANIATTGKSTFTRYTFCGGFHWTPQLVLQNSAWEGTVEQKKLAYLKLMSDRIFKGIAKSKDNLLVGLVDSFRTQAFASSLPNYTWNAGTLSLDVNLAAWEQKRYWSNVGLLIKQNKMRMPLIEIGGLGSELPQIAQDMYPKGSSFSLENQDLNGQRNIPLYQSEHIDETGNSFVTYLLEDGSFAVIPNFKYEFRAGESTSDAKWSISDMSVNYLNDRVAMYWEKGKADNSSLMTNSSQSFMSVVEKYLFVHSFYVITPHNDDIATIVNPLLKIKGLTT